MNGPDMFVQLGGLEHELISSHSTRSRTKNVLELSRKGTIPSATFVWLRFVVKRAMWALSWRDYLKCEQSDCQLPSIATSRVNLLTRAQLKPQFLQ